MSFTEAEKMALLMGPIRRIILASGLLTAAGFNAAVARYTRSDGTIDWAGLTAFFLAIMPLIEQLITLLAG